MIRIKGTGNLLLDALSTLGLCEILFRIKPSIRFKINLGSSEPMEITNLNKDELKLLRKGIEEIRKEKRLRETLPKINKKKLVPAIEFFENVYGNISDVEFSNLDQGFILEKTRNKKLELLSMSLMPLYGKGANKWNSRPSDYSMYASRLLVLTYIIGLAYYSIPYSHHESGLIERSYVILTPPLGQEVEEEYVMSLRRVASIYLNTDEGKLVRALLYKAPLTTLPLLIFSTLDVSTLSIFIEPSPQLILFTIESKLKGKGEAVRRIEFMSSTSVLKFLYNMGEEVYSFKLLIHELLKQTTSPELSSLALEALLNMASAIEYSKPDKLLLAYYIANSLRERTEDKLWIPDSDCLTKAIEVLK
ncbi:MAG: hypothetical protein QXE05_04520 [Nitrososphaeria archaeon]